MTWQQDARVAARAALNRNLIAAQFPGVTGGRMGGEQCIVRYKYDGINCFNSGGGSITVIYRAISSGCFEPYRGA